MGIDIDYYSFLKQSCENRWKDLSDAIFDRVPYFISSMFGEFLKNPLCLSITSLLLFVAGVIVLRNIIRSLGSRNL